ncbi:MAG: hypothetical protein AB7P00_33845, partial [Sandaracinaceae bacterium]
EGALSPPMERFEAVLDALRRTVFRQETGLLGMSHQEWEARIGDLQERGLAAYSASDAGGWRRTYNEAQALQETASEQEFSRRKLDDPAYLTQRLLGALAYAKRVEHGLSDFVPSSNEDVRMLQVQERDRLLGTLQTKVSAPLATMGGEDVKSTHEVRQKLDQILGELDRIDTALERLPSLGLVTERK